MSDSTPGAAGLPDPGIPGSPPPDPALPEPAPPESAPPRLDPGAGLPPAAPTPGGDETARIPVEPEVAWNAPEPPQPLPWGAPASPAAPPSAGGWPPPDGSGLPPAVPLPPPATPASGQGGWTQPGTTGVLSAATVGWVVPPPAPLATGNPGWVIASTGVRFVAYLLDGFLCGLILAAGVIASLAIAPSLGDGGVPVGIAYGVASAGLYYVYFVGFWTSGSKATIGMRLFRLQVANASDGKRLTIGSATIRWLGLGYFFSLVSIIPAAAALASLGEFVWWIVLLITTASDGMHQGLHDRWAKSVIVRPEGAGNGTGALAACGIILLVIVLFVVASFVALIFLGSQVSKILSTVGASI